MEVRAINAQTNISSAAQNKKTETSGQFSDYLTTQTSLDEIFQKAADKYGVSKDLLKAIGKAESGFDENATSSCGAQGIMQLMPSTAESLGVDDAYDAEQNIMGGAKYISQLLKKYDGNTSLALAAYNAGSGNVAKYGGIPPFKETQNYVKKVLGYIDEGVSIPADKNTTTVSQNTTSQIQSEDTDDLTQTVSTDLTSLLQEYNQDMDQVYSYEDYGKLIAAYFQSLALTPFMDTDQAQSVNDELNQQLDKMNDKIDSGEEDGNTSSDAYLTFQTGQYKKIMNMITGETTEN